MTSEHAIDLLQTVKCANRGHAWGPRYCVAGARPYRVDVVKTCARCGTTTRPLLEQPEDGHAVAFQVHGGQKVTVHP